MNGDGGKGPYWLSVQPLERIGCDEDEDLGLESGERPLSPELHLHVEGEVPRALGLPVEVHGARVSVQLPGAEAALLVSLRDADDDVVPRVGGGGSDAEDLSGEDDVGLEADVIVGDPQRGVLTVQVVGTADPLAAPDQGGMERR